MAPASKGALLNIHYYYYYNGAYCIMKNNINQEKKMHHNYVNLRDSEYHKPISQTT